MTHEARSTKPLAIAVGDPAGVGPVVSVEAALACVRAPCVLFGDAAQLGALAEARGRSLRPFTPGGDLPAGEVGVVDTGRVSPAAIAKHAPSAEAGAQQVHTLEAAAAFVQSGQGRAVVTGPTSKAAIVRAGRPFVGQTEHLARLAGLADDDVTMMFLGPRLRVALVTTHLSVANVPVEITALRVKRTVRHMGQVLCRLFPSSPRRLAVSGLNPHAGEEGLFGREELDVIAPCLAELTHETMFRDAVQLSGPVPAEAVFRAAQRGDLAGVVAMFHDQATIASKLLDWGAAVNTTWGLPFVRTSVDHGVAYDAARAGTAEADGMHAAVDMAIALTEPHG